LLVLGTGDGIYFLGLSFPATFAYQACFMALGLTILVDSIEPPSVFLPVLAADGC